jgi:hypothetical protein
MKFNKWKLLRGFLYCCLVEVVILGMSFATWATTMGSSYSFVTYWLANNGLFIGLMLVFCLLYWINNQIAKIGT